MCTSVPGDGAAAFLLFAGAGSYLSARRGVGASIGASITAPFIGIAAVATTFALASPQVLCR